MEGCLLSPSSCELVVRIDAIRSEKELEAGVCTGDDGGAEKEGAAVAGGGEGAAVKHGGENGGEAGMGENE